jgi:hypothetical protein
VVSKAHHFIPVGHLARFSLGNAVPRECDLQIFDKRANGYRTGKTGKVAFETNLYAYRSPSGERAGVESFELRTFDDLGRWVRDAATKDAFVESDKAGIEERGLRAIADLSTWSTGDYHLDEDQRVDALAYVGLLLAQHPSMMARRAEAVSARFWAKASDRIAPTDGARRLFAGMDHGISVLAMILDALCTARELNYLAWKVVHWRNSPRLILGDSAVVAMFPGNPLGTGDTWTPGATFALPIDPGCVLFIGEFAPGLCVVEDRSGPDAASEIMVMNITSWARARAEVYGAERVDLIATQERLEPISPTGAFPNQLPVRTSVLPDFAFDDQGDLRIVHPPDALDDDLAERYRARFVDPP